MSPKSVNPGFARNRLAKPNQTWQNRGHFGQKITSKSWKMDLYLLMAAIFLTLFGLMMVYDVSAVQALNDYGDKYFYVKQQLVWIMVGFSVLTFFSFFDYSYLKKVATPIFILSTILMVAVFIPGLGIGAGGAHRWLRVGGLTIQPGEIMKLTSVIFFASIFQKQKSFLFFMGIVALVSTILAVLQRDLGTTVVFFLTSVSMFFIAGAPLSYFVATPIIALAGFTLFIITSEYRKHRVLAFLDPFSDPQGYSYHISQVLIALGSGGLFGLGLGQSRQKFEYIPEVSTDSIFAVIGEEFGFIGGLALIAVFAFLIYRGLNIAEETEDGFGKLVSFGITALLGFQVIVNLAAMVSLTPLTGVPLPFVSYGGSALLANLTGIGILLNISKAR